MSTGVAAMKIPDSPPITNIATNATALSIGTVNLMLPRHIVPIQLNVFTAEGTAITSVDTMNDDPSVGFMPRSEEHTSELQSRLHLVCRLLLEKKKKQALQRQCSASFLASALPSLIGASLPWLVSRSFVRRTGPPCTASGSRASC